jgi:hypothetical protein
MLANPNSVLTDAFANQTIISWTQLSVASPAAQGIGGGGVEAIAFLTPNATPVPPTSATFWVELVQGLNGSPNFWQLQYTQTVTLNFAGIPWPHVSVATLTLMPASFTGAAQTANGSNFLTVVNDGGLTNASSSIQTFATTVGVTEQFTLQWLDRPNGKFALKTSNGSFVTAVGGGGHGGPNTAAAPIHTDATTVGTWERLTFVLQDNDTYAIKTDSGFFLTATNGGGVSDPIMATTATTVGVNETFKLIGS